MEPAVRSPRTEPAISTDRVERSVLAPKLLPRFPGCPRWSQPGRGERNFWMQRREAKIGLRDRKCRRRPKAQNDTGENPRRNGLFWLGLEICGLVGLDGGRDRDRTCDPLDVNEVLSLTSPALLAKDR